MDCLCVRSPCFCGQDVASYSSGALVVTFDPSLPYDKPEGGYNRGCPPGYFAEFVGVGEAGSTPLGGGSTTAVRCRLVEGTTAADIQRETGTTTSETVGVVTGAIGDTMRQLGEKLKNGPGGGWSWGGLVALGLVAALALGAGNVARAVRG